MVTAGVLSCEAEDLSETVTPDVCLSGLRWAGGERGSGEMLPGSDCVGCHLDTGAPELIFGGTFYGASDGELGIGAWQDKDCYGLPGVAITITGADGRNFEAITNRAGNFWTFGRADELVKPYRAEYRYERPGEFPEVGSMGTVPSYGGCARCHGAYGSERFQISGSAVKEDYVFATEAMGLSGVALQDELLRRGYAPALRAEHDVDIAQ